MVPAVMSIARATHLEPEDTVRLKVDAECQCRVSEGSRWPCRRGEVCQMAGVAPLVKRLALTCALVSACA